MSTSFVCVVRLNVLAGALFQSSMRMKSIEKGESLSDRFVLFLVSFHASLGTGAVVTEAKAETEFCSSIAKRSATLDNRRPISFHRALRPFIMTLHLVIAVLPRPIQQQMAWSSRFCPNELNFVKDLRGVGT